MFSWKRAGLIALGLIILCLIFIVAILPGIIENKAKEWVSAETGRKLEIESISINPLSLSVEINNLHLSEKDHNVRFLSWDKLRVSLSAVSAFHRAPIIDEFHLERPHVSLERQTPETFNFSDLIPASEEKTNEDKSAEPFRFAVDNITINNGKIDLIDNSLDEPVHHTIAELNLALPTIGNFPHMVDTHAQPQLSAIINDSPFNIEGQLKPFTDVQEMLFDLKLDNIDLPHYLGYVPVELPVEIRNGKLNLDLKIIYRISPQTGSDLELRGNIDLVSVNIWDRLKEQLFFLPLLQLEMAPSYPLKQDIHLSFLRIYNLEVQLNRDKSGVWNHSRMAPPAEDSATDTETDETSNPLKLKIDDIEVRDGVIVFEDKLPAGGFKTIAREINIDVNNFALDTTTNIPLELSLETDREETVRIKGDFLLKPFSLSLNSNLDNLSLAAYKPYYQEFYNKPLGGTLELDTNLLINEEKPLLVTDGSLSINNLLIAFNDNEEFSNSRTNLAGISFDLGLSRLEIGSIDSTGTHVNFSRSKSGEWSFLSRNFPILTKSAQETGAAAKNTQNETKKDFSFLIGNLDLQDWNVDFTDRQPQEKALVQIHNMALSVGNLALPDKTESPVKFSALLPPGGELNLDGKFVLAQKSADLKSSLRRFPLKTIGPYLAEYTNMVLTNGNLNANLGTRVRASDELAVDFNGRLGINKMHLLDGTHKEDLLKWDSLQIAGIKGGLSPLSLGIDSITLSDYFAKVLIDEEARLNLVEAFSNKESNDSTEVDEKKENPVETEVVADNSPEERPDVRIDKIVLQGGQVDYTDRNLPRTFHADMQELGGQVNGLSSEPDSRATVDLRGSLRGQSSLDISGQLNPLAKDLFLDIELNFNDIELSPFSPYSGNYVGYLIEKGKLNLSLDYYIEDNQLKADNKVFLDQFNFGAAVESEDAISLPVKLAVALLKDRKGEIHLDIPVYGNMDNPQFSIASVVWKVIRNLLVKAATSPFALLGALVGGGEEDFSTVTFEYGSARLGNAEKDKLQQMAKALLERPSLAVEVSGFIDPENDPEGYRKEALETKVRRLKYLDLVNDGELPEGVQEEDVVIPEEEYPDYLWDVYKEEDFPKPRNFIGMTKRLPVNEMEKLIYTNTEVDSDALAALSQARALTVQNFLIEEGQLPKQRIFLKKPDIKALPEEETATRARVELGASVK